MDRPLLDKLRDYTLLNYYSKHCFQALKTALISALIKKHTRQYRYISNRPLSADNIGKTIYQSGPSFNHWKLLLGIYVCQNKCYVALHSDSHHWHGVGFTVVSPFYSKQKIYVWNPLGWLEQSGSRIPVSKSSQFFLLFLFEKWLKPLICYQNSWRLIFCWSINQLFNYALIANLIITWRPLLEMRGLHN